MPVLSGDHRHIRPALRYPQGEAAALIDRAISRRCPAGQGRLERLPRGPTAVCQIIGEDFHIMGNAVIDLLSAGIVSGGDKAAMAARAWDCSERFVSDSVLKKWTG